MKKVIAIFIFITFQLQAYTHNCIDTKEYLFVRSEEATLHFLDGTSVRGYGKIKDFLGIHKIKFKAGKESKPDTWDDLLVKGITFHGEHEDVEFMYVKIKHKPGPMLLEVLELGEISIFIDVNSYWVNPNTKYGNPNPNQLPIYNINYRETSFEYYVKKENEEIGFSFSSVINFKKKAKEYFKNCPMLVEKIDNRELKRGDILEIVYYYNDYCAELD